MLTYLLLSSNLGLYLDEYDLLIMGFFGKSKYEKHEEKLSETLTDMLQDELEVSELKSICRDLVGSIPKME